MRHRALSLFTLALTVVLSPQPIAAQSSNLGKIDFPNSGAAEAQESFIRGVLFLHSFEYDDAGEAFREAQRTDPDFAMAYWGEAMSYNHPVWRQQDRESAVAVLERLGPSPEARDAKARTQREKDYLAALEVLYGEGDKQGRDDAFAQAMRRLHQKYPKDPEAAVFYALSLLGTAHEGRDVPTYIRAAAVAEEVFRENPQHPGAAHYMIHSYDDPVHAPLGLRAARAYSKIAPAASHAQHMTSHIFMAMGMWEDVVAANEIAWEVADERVKQKQLSVDARNFHALAWLEYGYLQGGRHSDALRTVEVMRDDVAQSGSRRARSYLAAMRATYVVNARDWEGEAVAIEVDVSDLNPATAAGDHFATAVAALGRGDRAPAEAISEDMRVKREAAIERGSTHPPDLRAAEVMEMALQSMLYFESGEVDRAVSLMREATSVEDAIPFVFGPPDIVKPSHELLGEMLLELDRPHEALEEFEAALARAPRRVDSLLGFAAAAERMGDRVTAEEAYAEVRQIWYRADPDIATRLGTR